MCCPEQLAALSNLNLSPNRLLNHSLHPNRNRLPNHSLHPNRNRLRSRSRLLNRNQLRSRSRNQRHQAMQTVTASRTAGKTPRA